MKCVNCPTCRKPITWDDRFPFRPFCNERCRLIDLGQWAEESYRIPTSKGASPYSEYNEQDTSAISH